jgi:hypothetical protein
VGKWGFFNRKPETVNSYFSTRSAEDWRHAFGLDGAPERTRKREYVLSASALILGGLCARVDGSKPSANVQLAVDMAEKLYDYVWERIPNPPPFKRG